MVRQLRNLALIGVLLGLAITVLAIPEIKIRGFERGQPDTILGLTLGLDLQGGTHLVYRATTADGGTPSQDDMEGVRKVIEKRVNEFGVAETSVQLLGTPPDRIVIQMPGMRGASITSEIYGIALTQQALQDFLRTQAGHPEATVTTSQTGASVMRFDDLQAQEVDQAGNVTVRAEADVIREKIEQAFPVTITAQYISPQSQATPEPAATPGADATPEALPTAEGTPEATATPGPLEDLPTLEEVQQAVAAVRPDATVTESATGVFQIKIVGPKDRSRDAAGGVVPSDEEKLRDSLRGIGALAGFGPCDSGGQKCGADRILTWTPGGGVQEAKRLIGSTAQLEFRERICAPVESRPPELGVAEWALLRCNDPSYYTEQPTDIRASDLTDAFAGTQPGVARPVVNIVFNDDGAAAFFRVTDRISRTGDLLAIYLDGEELVAPQASQGIAGGRAFIQGPDFTAERARTIAIQLRSGALPVDLNLIQERNVDATLGSDSLQKTLLAGATGLIILFAFMTLYYKVPGLVASMALLIYTTLLLAIFKTLPVTVTLAGAAAFILTLGMAVDANVLIAERTKEEIRSGRTLMAAIAEGFARSWPSIRDGHFAMLITAVVLFWFGDRFGTSLMQGFALTLIIGTLLNLFTAVVVSRTLTRIVAMSPVGRLIGLFTPVSHRAPMAESPAPAGGAK